jgi:hypothetical protein
MCLKTFLFLSILLLTFSACTVNKINRKEVVQRHNITIRETNLKPAQVGNGNFALMWILPACKHLHPHNTLSHWGFHSMPLPEGLSPDDFKGIVYKINGRPVEFEITNPEQPVLSKWLAANPHAANLGRIGLLLTHQDGSAAGIADLKVPVQHLDLWTGVITSTFDFDGNAVAIKTACHPKRDEIGIEIASALISKGQLKVALDFPYADDREFADLIGDYNSPQKHSTGVQKGKRNLAVHRTIDDLKYSVTIRSEGGVNYKMPDSLRNPHKIVITPASNRSNFSFHFTKDSVLSNNREENIFRASAEGWKNYWSSGAAIDFAACTDPRAAEMERRVVTSQYLMKVNNAGSLPPAETGLLKNSWYGKFHFEMIWWHGVHFAVWNRWNELDKMLHVYQNFLPTSTERAKKQGYPGARWPKATGNKDREWPFIIHAFLIWQQPHPIYFAELDYRLHPTNKTLEKWKDVVFATADFMAAYPLYDSVAKQYNIDAPVFIVSENTNHDSTKNPAFELSYWRYGLRTAIEWRRRLHLPEAPAWNAVLRSLAPLRLKITSTSRLRACRICGRNTTSNTPV